MTILNKTSNVSIDGAIDGSLTSYSSESGSVSSATLLRPWLVFRNSGV